MFGRSWRIGSVGGVAINVDSSWAVIAILITYSLWARFDEPGFRLSGTAAFGLALFTSVLFFGSVLIHELAHAGMARARDIPVAGITLFIFGGATAARVEDKGPADEFLVTAVGPGSSFALAGIFWVLSKLAGHPLSLGLRYVAGVNLLLAIFNLIPGFPLDGGRILRSLIWRGTGNLERATRIAAGVGQVVAFGLIGVALWQVATGFLFGAVWLGMIGWMLLQAARGTMYQQRVRSVLARGIVADAMRPPPEAIPAGLSLSESLDTYLRGHEEEGFPVVEGERLVGLLTFPAASRVGRHDPLRPVRDAMLPLSDVVTVRADETLDRVSDTLSGRAALVLADGRLVGAITPEDLSRWMRANRRP